MPRTPSRRSPKPKVLSAPIPKTRDPFINTPLLRLTPDPHSGAERFWISTWNSHHGSTAALVNEHGKSRLYHFKPPHFGFYSAVQEDDDTLWLCGDLSRVVRFTLSSGKVETFPTNAPAALNFQGMILDPASGKLFAAAFPPPRSQSFVFDYRQRKPVQIQPIPGQGHYGRFSFPNGDGTWSLLMHLPGDHLIIWDPSNDQLEEVVLQPHIEPHDVEATTYALIADECGRYYLPNLGWYQPRTRQVEDGPRPQREMTWKRRLGSQAVGCHWDSSGLTIGAWDLLTGKVRQVCRIPDATAHSFNVTDSGKIIAVNVFGQFFRFDLTSGALEMSTRLDSDAVGHTDCLCRIDERRLLGTTFITQRFWEADLKTGRGEDLGRAAPGVGEIMQLIKVGAKVYMAAYTGGELVEYDPAQRPGFPENPRVVADPPGGMRPVAICTDDRCVYYTCSNDYGNLGCVVTRYDTKTGLAGYHRNPLGDQMINTLFHDRRTRSLLVGTTFHADCQSAPPTSNRTCVARLDDASLRVLEKFDSVPGAWVTMVRGPLGKGKWLISIAGPERPWYVLREDHFALPGDADRFTLPEHTENAHYAGQAGLFVVQRRQELELWDFARHQLIRSLWITDAPIHRLFIQGKDVILLHPDRATVLDGCLRVK